MKRTVFSHESCLMLRSSVGDVAASPKKNVCDKSERNLGKFRKI